MLIPWLSPTERKAHQSMRMGSDFSADLPGGNQLSAHSDIDIGYLIFLLLPGLGRDHFTVILIRVDK